MQDATFSPKSPHYSHLEIRNPTMRTEIPLCILPLLSERNLFRQPLRKKFFYFNFLTFLNLFFPITTSSYEAFRRVVCLI